MDHYESFSQKSKAKQEGMSVTELYTAAHRAADTTNRTGMTEAEEERQGTGEQTAKDVPNKPGSVG